MPVFEMPLEELKTYRGINPGPEDFEAHRQRALEELERSADEVELTGTALMDQVCPPSTQFAACNKIRSKKEMVLYPDFGHQTLPVLLARL